MTDKIKVFMPMTPGGSLCAELQAGTEDEAWERLMGAASHMPYEGKQEFIGVPLRVVEHDDIRG